MDPDALRLYGPLVLGLASATAFDQLTRTRGLEPPGFRNPWRRLLATTVVAGIFFLMFFAGLGQIGLPEPPVRELSRVDLFSFHEILVVALIAWYLLGFAGKLPAGRSLGGEATRQLGFVSARPLREVGLGLALGVLAWPALIVTILLVAGALVALGNQGLLDATPPPLIVQLAALPVGWKLAIALSAGVVEEAFFRGLLQPRVGIAISSLLFVLAHLSYGQPFMLAGIALLSLFFAGLVHWRQNLWPAIAAHFLFDAVQLLFLIPWALEQWSAGGKTIGPVLLPW